MIQLTDDAKKRFKELTAGTDRLIYLKLQKTGCSGFSYKLDAVGPDVPNATLNDFGDFQMLVDNEALPYIEGITIDYQKEGFNHSFKFLNPNERDRCGCGLSFRV